MKRSLVFSLLLVSCNWLRPEPLVQVQACDVPECAECPEPPNCQEQIKNVIDGYEKEIDYIKGEKGRCTGCGWESSFVGFKYDIVCYSGGVKIFATKIDTKTETTWDLSDNTLTISDKDDIKTVVTGNCIVKEYQ